MFFRNEWKKFSSISKIKSKRIGIENSTLLKFFSKYFLNFPSNDNDLSIKKFYQIYGFMNNIIILLKIKFRLNNENNFELEFKATANQKCFPLLKIFMIMLESIFL